MIAVLSIHAPHPGLHLITGQIEEVVAAAAQKSVLAEDLSGLCTVFIRHTSASLIIQENADRSARNDLERWLNKLVPETGPTAAAFTHTSEGPDDMPSHIKSALTATSLSIPVIDGRLALGTWQGVYLWEHRRSAHHREVVVHVGP